MSINCAECGKFIAYKDFDDGSVESYYAPDSEYTYEEIYYWHKECDKNSGNS